MRPSVVVSCPDGSRSGGVSRSVSDLREIAYAYQIGLDFVVLCGGKHCDGATHEFETCGADVGATAIALAGGAGAPAAGPARAGGGKGLADGEIDGAGRLVVLDAFALGVDRIGVGWGKGGEGEGEWR